MSTRIVKIGSSAVAAVVLAVLASLFVVPARTAQATAAPRDEEWWFSAWAIKDKVWPLSTGRGVTVAVIDTGVNAGLPELRGAVVPGADSTGQGRGDGRRDLDKELGGHGTGMAALIAGQGGPAHMVGVAPDAKIMPILTDGFSVDQATAIRYAVGHGAKVVSISLSSPDVPGQQCGSDLQEAIADAVRKNVVIVASAGNKGHENNPSNFPASCAGVLAVGAVDSHLRAWLHTERQSYVAVAAPGWGVGTIEKHGRFLNNLSGTSQAAALTSAVAAIMRARFPSMSAREIVQRIINTTVDAGPKGHDNKTGAGAVVPEFALTKRVGKNAANPPFERLDRWRAGHSASPTASASTAARPSPTSTEKHTSSALAGLLSGLVVVMIGLAIFALATVLVIRRYRSASRPAVAETASRYPPARSTPGPQPPLRVPPPAAPPWQPPPDQPTAWWSPPPGHRLPPPTESSPPPEERDS